MSTARAVLAPCVRARGQEPVRRGAAGLLQELTEPELRPRAAGLAAFCLLSGAFYAFNDVRDAEADRRHPSKRAGRWPPAR